MGLIHGSKQATRLNCPLHSTHFEKKEEACDVLERGPGQVPCGPGISALGAMTTLGGQRARLVRALMDHIGILYEHAA